MSAVRSHVCSAGMFAFLLFAACGCEKRPEGPATPEAEAARAQTRRFRHPRSRLAVSSGSANHRGRDALVLVSAPQTLEATFAYGPTDQKLVDEDVVIERVLPDSNTEHVATLRTSIDKFGHDGGRIEYALPADRALGPGRHRFRFTVFADQTQTELSLIVVTAEQPAFVSDVDGTLTTSELPELPALPAQLPRTLGAAHPDAAAVFQRLAARGLVPIYLTARPEWMTGRTRSFLQERGFPPGVLITRRDTSSGLPAAELKLVELERLAQRVRIGWAFGSLPSDADAFAPLVPNPRRRILYRVEDRRHGARRIESYAELFAEVNAEPEAARTEGPSPSAP